MREVDERIELDIEVTVWIVPNVNVTTVWNSDFYPTEAAHENAW